MCTLRVNEIFYSIQGEGPFIGAPAVFVRLAGCNLKCSFCDTKHEDNVIDMSVPEVHKRVRAYPHATLVVITGGEPLLQKEPLLELIDGLGDHIVQIETNGTIPADDLIRKGTFVVCSPKWDDNHIYSDWGVVLSFRHESLKFVVKKDDVIPALLLPVNANVFIQPMDEKDPVKNKANTDYAVKLCLNNNWRLSLQLQKILGVR